MTKTEAQTKALADYREAKKANDDAQLINKKKPKSFLRLKTLNARC